MLSNNPLNETKTEVPKNERYAVSKGIYTLGLLPFEYVRLVLDRATGEIWLEAKIEDMWFKITPKIKLEPTEVPE